MWELGKAVEVCPEVLGGFGIPRVKATLFGGTGEAVLAGEARVVTEDGADVTAAFIEGARRVLRIAREYGAKRAYLKQKSPSCGYGSTYIGGKLAPGNGVTAALLASEGVEIIPVD